MSQTNSRPISVERNSFRFSPKLSAYRLILLASCLRLSEMVTVFFGGRGGHLAMPPLTKELVEGADCRRPRQLISWEHGVFAVQAGIPYRLKSPLKNLFAISGPSFRSSSSAPNRKTS